LNVRHYLSLGRAHLLQLQMDRKKPENGGGQNAARHRSNGAVAVLEKLLM